MVDQAQSAMPRYRCHKEVWALKILSINANPTGESAALEVEYPFSPVPVDDVWLGRHNPQAGGYLVFYEDGYRSYSPAKAFEEGYSRI
jgi:hypothetical protein